MTSVGRIFTAASELREAGFFDQGWVAEPVLIAALVAIGALRESDKMITRGTKDTALASTNDWASIVGNKFKIQQQEQLSLLRDNKIGRGRAKAWLDTGVRDAAKMAGRPLLSAQETVSRSAGGDVPGAEAMARAIATVRLRRSGYAGATSARFCHQLPA